MSTPFDKALELRELREAAHAYASRYGEPGSPDYREAWLRFRQQIETNGDLRRVGNAHRAGTDAGPGS